MKRWIALIGKRIIRVGAKLFFLLHFAFFLSGDCFANQPVSLRFLEKLKVGNGRIIPLPLVVYSPETSFGFGISAQYLFRFKNDSTGNLSSAGITLLYTLKKQFIVNPNWDLFLRKGQFRVAGAFVYQKYPEDFFGIGNFTKKSHRETFTAQYILFKNRFIVRVIPKLYLGLQYRLEYAFNVQPKENGILDTMDVPGNKGYRASGIGIAAVFDSREHSLFPFFGTYIVFSNHFYFKQIGSNVRLMNFKIDARKYFNPGGSHVIAIQGLAEFNVLEPPFKMMALLGGSEIMRGYYQGRYRERHLLATQVEYRFPIWWRFIGAAFFGVGEVAHELNDFTFPGLKYSYGGGLRFTLDAKERINVRFDAGFGVEGSKGFYFQLTEAF